MAWLRRLDLFRRASWKRGPGQSCQNPSGGSKSLSSREPYKTERREVWLRVEKGLLKVARQLAAEAPVGLALSTSPQPSGSERKQNEGQWFFPNL